MVDQGKKQYYDNQNRDGQDALAETNAPPTSRISQQPGGLQL